jgi:folate-binding protein YgfZ
MLATTQNSEPSAVSGEIRAEFQALLSGCGMYDLSSRAKIKLAGTDRVRWLNGMVTNNVRDLAVGYGIYAFLLNPQGRILGDLYAYNHGEALWLDTDQTQAAKLLEVFDHYIIMDDVEVENISEKFSAIGISGAKSSDVLQSVGIQIADMLPLELQDLAWNQVSLTLIRGEKERRESYEIWGAPENAQKLRDALVHGGALPIGAEALELYRIALGIPRYSQDIRERDLPQETGQARALNFSKGCYVGQEIVERIRSRGAVHRTFVGFMFEGALPPVGTKVQVDGKDVGEITSAASLPLKSGHQGVALGYIRREAVSLGKEILADGKKAVVSELPFKVVFE